MEREEIPWKIFHDINFVSLFYTPFDASEWEVIESGPGKPLRLVLLLLIPEKIYRILGCSPVGLD